jgi:phosphatidylinositol alpha-mannosyltransferase
VRVALACPYAWDDPGGVQVHVRALAERLLLRGHDVVVLAPARGAPDEPWVAPVGRPIDIRFNNSNAPIDPRPWSRRHVRSILSSFVPDVVHAHEPLTPSTGLWSLLESPAPVVGTFHSGVSGSRLYDLASPLLRRAARRLAVRLAVSEHAARVAQRRIGGFFEIVPNGVDVERFSGAAPGDLGPGTKLVFVGRLDPRKGFPTAVSAFARLAADRPDLHFVVVGDGPDRDAVKSLASGLRERVVMLGPVPNRELAPVLAACDLYLGPSIGGESFGVVLVEAMAAGLPVVASAVPGYEEVVRDQVDGLLVPPRDAGSLAEAVARVLDDGELRERLVAAGLLRARTFDWSVVVERLEGVYLRAARGETGTRGPSLR